MSLQFFINSLNKEIDDSLDDLLLLYNDQLFTKKKVNRLSTQKKNSQRENGELAQLDKPSSYHKACLQRYPKRAP